MNIDLIINNEEQHQDFVEEMQALFDEQYLKEKNGNAEPDPLFHFELEEVEGELNRYMLL